MFQGMHLKIKKKLLIFEVIIVAVYPLKWITLYNIIH